MPTIREVVAEKIRERRELPPPEECRARRLRAGFSERGLGAICGVSGSTIHLWEHGLRRPTGPRLSAYFEALQAMEDA